MSSAGKLLGIGGLLALLSACGTVHGVEQDSSSAYRAVAGPSKPNVHHDNYIAPTSPEQDKAALDQADQRADDQAARAKQARHEAADRVSLMKANQANREAKWDDARIARAQHNLDVAKQTKLDADARRIASGEVLSKDDIISHLQNEGYYGITLNKQESLSTAEHAIYAGTASKDGKTANVTVDDTASVTVH